MNRKTAGFSLLEMMIVLGIGAIAMIGVSSLIINSQKGQQNVSSHADFNSLSEMLQTVLAGDPTTCGKYFQNTVFNPPSIAPGPINPPVQIPKIALGGTTLMDNSKTVPLPWVRRFSIATRDKYGLGAVSGSMPVRKGDCWEINSSQQSAHGGNPNTGFVWWLPIQ